MTLGPLLVAIPWSLVLLGLLAPTWVLGRRRLAYSGLGRRRLVLTLRTLIVSLVVLSLADVRWQGPNTNKATVFLIDSSVSTAGFQASASSWVRLALDKMGPDDVSAVIAFAREPVVVQPLGQTRDFRAAFLPRDDRTDLAAALRLGQAVLPASGVRRLVVLSDGWENQGRAEDVVDGLAASGIVVDFVKPTFPQQGLVVKSVDSPPQVREGDPFDADVAIESAQAGDGLLTFTVDDQQIVRQTVRLRAGANLLTVPVTAAREGFHRIMAVVETANTPAAVGEGYFEVKPRGSILFYEDRAGEARSLVAIIEKAGLQTEVRPTASIPTSAGPLRPYDAIVLANVSATAMTLDQQKTLQTYVKVLGKGLIVVGGPNSYSLGDYGSSALNEMLPVHSDVPPKPEEGTFGLALVIDKSGSMDLKTDGVSKIQMAKEAALLSVDMLRDDDYIAITVFDTVNRWLVQPQKVAANRGVPAIQARIVGVQADGGTDIFPALERGFSGIRQTDARYKHVILLSDGEAPGGEYDRLLREMRGANVTLSAIAVGSDADTVLMSRLAKDGGGRYYFTERIRDIPRIVAKETSIAIGATTAEGKVQPQLVAPSAILRGLVPADLPTLQTYAVTTPRDAAETILMAPSGDPLLAQWQYGSGRTVAWTSSLRDEWAGDWKAWPDLTRFWGQAVRYAMGTPFEPGISVRTETQADQVTVTVDSATEDGNFVDLASVVAIDTGPSGKSTTLPIRQDAPGRYLVRYQASEAGAHELRVSIKKAGQAERTDTVGYVATPDSEARTLAPNDRLLRRLAGATGGRQISVPDSAFADGPRPSGVAWRPLWPWLLGLALVLFPLDIAARRLRGFGLPRRRR